MLQHAHTPYPTGGLEEIINTPARVKSTWIFTLCNCWAKEAGVKSNGKNPGTPSKNLTGRLGSQQASGNSRPAIFYRVDGAIDTP